MHAHIHILILNEVDSLTCGVERLEGGDALVESVFREREGVTVGVANCGCADSRLVLCEVGECGEECGRGGEGEGVGMRGVASTESEL